MIENGRTEYLRDLKATSFVKSKDKTVPEDKQDGSQ